MAELIDKTYGEALFQLSLEEGKVEQYADEVRSIKEANLCYHRWCHVPV